MAKRGRKPSQDKDKYYFLEKEEAAVQEYNKHTDNIINATKKILQLSFNCDDDALNLLCSGHSLYELMKVADELPIDGKEKKNEINSLMSFIRKETNENGKIYKNTLYPAFTKMIESFIRTMKGVPGEEFIDTFHDALSFLMDKISMYDPSRGTKAYSYMGTVCKHYLMSRRETAQKNLIRHPSYDANENEYTNNIRYATVNNKARGIASDSIKKLTTKIQYMIDHKNDYDLKENEIKVGMAMINLFENWEFALYSKINGREPSEKLNKNSILFFLREQTGLDTKGLRDNMKKYKKEYIIIKDLVISEQ